MRSNTPVLHSAKKPAFPEHESVRLNLLATTEGAALAALQRDLLGEHDVSDRQLAHRLEARANPWAAFFVDFADVRQGARIDPASLAGVAADDLEIAAFRQPCSLRRRQPLSQKPQRPAFRSFFGAVSN